MLNEILNLEGVAVLSKDQQKSVNGGVGTTCILRIVENGQSHVWKQDFVGKSTRSLDSKVNNACLDVIAGGATRCSYNCDYDGWNK
jgi:hypothetical protein